MNDVISQLVFPTHIFFVKKIIWNTFDIASSVNIPLLHILEGSTIDQQIGMHLNRSPIHICRQSTSSKHPLRGNFLNSRYIFVRRAEQITSSSQKHVFVFRGKNTMFFMKKSNMNGSTSENKTM